MGERGRPGKDGKDVDEDDDDVVSSPFNRSTLQLLDINDRVTTLLSKRKLQ